MTQQKKYKMDQKKRQLQVAVGLILIISVFTHLISPSTLKIGIVKPPDSPWHKALTKLASLWQKSTAGKVKIRIIGKGTESSDGILISEMKMGKLDGAVLFSRDMPRILPELYLLNIPLLINSKKGHDYVFNKIKPPFEKSIEDRGFKVITWELSGWVRLFTKDPVFYPKDLDTHKVSFTTWNPGIDKAWQDSGFHIIPTQSKDLMMALQDGTVDAFFHSPLVAESREYFKLALNMSSFRADKEYWAIIVTKAAWKKIPLRFKNKLKAQANNISARLYRKMIKLENEAIESMESQGLLINRLPANALEQWKSVIKIGGESLCDKIYSKEMYLRMIQYIKEYEEKEN
jgi:TRAP-type transport system periplasmic protein